MDFNIAVTQILILFTIMFIGVIARKKNIINEHAKDALSTIIVNIGMPCLVLSSTNFQSSSDIRPNIINIFVITAIYYVAVIIISFLIVKVLKIKVPRSNVFISLLVFANVGFIGYPVARAFFQEVGIFYAAIANLLYHIVMWTFGILLFDSKEKIKFSKIFNVGAVSCAATIILFLSGLKLPYIIQNALQLTGNMSVPLSMILIGAMIAEVKIVNMFSDKDILIMTFIKNFLLPIITAVILKFLGFNAIVISICTLMAAMPSGALNAIFAREYDAEPVFASIGVFVSTLLCIISLPVVVFFLTTIILK